MHNKVSIFYFIK